MDERTKNLVDGGVTGKRAVEDVELPLEALRDVVAAPAGVNHGSQELNVRDVGEVARLLQVVHAFCLQKLTHNLVRHLNGSDITHYGHIRLTLL